MILLFSVTVVHIIRFVMVGIIHGFTNHHAANSTMSWCRSLVKNLNINVEMNGMLPSQGVLFVSNHRSYIDVAVAGQYFPCTFLTKRELADWPISGLAAKLAKVIFADRNYKNLMDFGNGDEILQVGYASVLAAIRHAVFNNMKKFIPQ